jgi:hypothetical protein
MDAASLCSCGFSARAGAIAPGRASGVATFAARLLPAQEYYDSRWRDAVFELMGG